MSEQNFVKRFQDLGVYQLARELANDIFAVSNSSPREEAFSLTDQIRRSSRSIGAQIAEAWGKRRYEKHFVSKLTDADSEQLETQHWLLIAFNCEYITEEQYRSLMRKSMSIGKMLGRMIQRSSSFCNPKAITYLKEESTEYRIPNTEYQNNEESLWSL